MDGKTLLQDVTRYSEFSPHMTATPTDVRTSQWMAKEMKRAGLEVEMQAWELRQFFVDKCELGVGEQKVDAFPSWYPKATGKTPVEAPLVLMTKETPPEDLKGRIALVTGKEAGIEVYFRGIKPYAKKAAKAGAAGLVVTVVNGADQLAPVNARDPFHQEPLPLPSVIIAMKDEKRLVEAAKAGESASIEIQGKDRGDAVAFNVIGRLERGPKWIVVTTPTSGWFKCAGERGPGVALFLGLARWAAQSDSQFSYLFLGNSGHELDNIGAHHTMEKYAPPPKKVACWIHLGASIATRNWERTDSGLKPLDQVNPKLNLVGTKELMPVLQSAFKEVPGYEPRSKGRVAGELRHFISAGYQAFGFFGGHMFFHTRHDSPRTTGPELLEPVARALVQSIERVENR